MNARQSSVTEEVKTRVRRSSSSRGPVAAIDAVSKTGGDQSSVDVRIVGSPRIMRTPAGPTRSELSGWRSSTSTVW